jgi:pSer/pThr/pTyr-binding forkhead associated (FHA) protein
MDDVHAPYEADRPCGPRLANEPEIELPADFVPLRLLLQPGGLCVELNKPDMLIGRHSTADVRLSLPDISRRHCRFTFSDGSWRVFDLSSLNGVFVNGERLHEATVFHGDRVRLGSLTFEVELTPTPAQPRVTRLMPNQQPTRKAS